MAYYLSPVFQDAQLATSTGIPLVGGKLYTYLASSTTPATVYQDDAGGSSHTNPIILNARGEPPAPIWINGGQSIKFALHDAADVPIRTIDDVTGVGDPTGITNTVSEWMTFSHAPTYVSAASFMVAGNQTADLNVGRRVKIPVSGNTSYGTITASAFGAVTTVTINTTGSVGLDSSIDALSTFEIGLLSGSNQSVPYPLASFEYTTAGSSGTYTLATICLGTLTTGERIRVKFHTAGPATGVNTLNRDSLGAKALKRYDTTGAKINANITAGLLTDIEYDGTDYVVLTPLDLPHGKTRYTSNGTWTAPAGVTTAWLTGCGPGGGGAGGNSATVGGGGGGGGQSVIAEAVTVVPGTSYTVTIGTGGAGSVSAAANGSAGSGATVFGSTLLSLAAGAGGTVSGAGGAAGGAGGSAQGGATGVNGYDYPVGGTGGSSMFGAGGAGGTSVVPPRTSSGYGSGGGGGAGAAVGAGGSNGFLLIEW
jgi:hypothetical protein